MTIVVDASVLVASLVDVRHEGLWARESTRRATLISPQLIYVESASGLRRMELAGEISNSVATSAMHDMFAVEIELRPFGPSAQRIWELRHNLTCYDAWYVALAESLNCPLLTLDRRIARVNGLNCEVLTAPDDPVRRSW
ncbi:MAG: type II toxin-antitoxin system VapC family toxin [Chloroflexi bacterium]|nr:type II toxin-antitoxin system VapC family toxin [Chloroflexota bacterium]MYF79007.1 type II toxin-antitoxin system VapC family toxin [Chloroflexota bacterium]MYK62505.1 type II toxin-antitoxin system VapC family toxin [Chloroflexota bacterium]